jgi:hypothetical protein
MTLRIWLCVGWLVCRISDWPRLRAACGRGSTGEDLMRRSVARGAVGEERGDGRGFDVARSVGRGRSCARPVGRGATGEGLMRRAR